MLSIEQTTVSNVRDFERPKESRLRYFFHGQRYEIGKLSDAETTLTEVIDYEDHYFSSDEETDDDNDIGYQGEENRNPNVDKATKRDKKESKCKKKMLPFREVHTENTYSVRLRKTPADDN